MLQWSPSPECRRDLQRAAAAALLRDHRHGIPSQFRRPPRARRPRQRGFVVPSSRAVPQPTPVHTWPSSIGDPCMCAPLVLSQHPPGWNQFEQLLNQFESEIANLTNLPDATNHLHEEARRTNPKRVRRRRPLHANALINRPRRTGPQHNLPGGPMGKAAGLRAPHPTVSPGMKTYGQPSQLSRSLHTNCPPPIDQWYSYPVSSPVYPSSGHTGESRPEVSQWHVRGESRRSSTDTNDVDPG